MLCRYSLVPRNDGSIEYEYNRLLYRVTASESPYDCLEFSYFHKVAASLVRANIESVIADSNYKHELDQLDSNGRTPLHWAAVRANIPVSETLLSAQVVSVKAKDYEGRTALHCAAISGNKRCIELLLIAGSDVFERDQYGHQALPLAMYFSKDTDVLNLLLMAGADINGLRHAGGSALHLACYGDCLDNIQALLAAGADMNVQDNNGDTPLFYAAHIGHGQNIELLLRHGANLRLEHRNKSGQTVLHILALWGTNETVAPFMSRSCRMDRLDIGARDKEGRTAWEVFQERSIIPEDFNAAFEGLLARCRAHREASIAAQPVEIGE